MLYSIVFFIALSTSVLFVTAQSAAFISKTDGDYKLRFIVMVVACIFWSIYHYMSH